MMAQLVDVEVNTDVSLVGENVVIHEGSRGSVVMIGEINQHYHLEVTSCFLDAIKQDGGTLQLSAREGEPLLRAVWKGNGGEQKGVFTKWKLEIKMAFIGMKRAILREIAQDAFDPLRRKIIEGALEKFKARFVALEMGCLEFIFWHIDDSSARVMIENKQEVTDMFNILLLTIQVKFTLTPTLHSQSSPEWKVIKDRVSPRLSSGAVVGEDTSLSDLRKDMSEFQEAVMKESKDIREHVSALRGAVGDLIKTVDSLKARPSHDHPTPPQVVQEMVLQRVKGLTPYPVQQQVATVARVQQEPQPIEGAAADLRSFSVSDYRSLDLYSEEIPQDSLYDEGGVANVQFDLSEKLKAQQQKDRQDEDVMEKEMSEEVRIRDKEMREEVRISGIIQRNSRRAEIMLHNLSVRLTDNWEGDQRVYRLINRIAIALEKEDPPPFKTSGLDTVLCVDASDSLGEGGLEDVKRAAHRFIDELEHVAEDESREENVSLVVMGEEVRMVRQLTNDYGSIRDAIDSIQLGGRSPIFEALLVCVSAIKEKGGTLVVSGVHKLHPRIIFITDGFPTSDRTQTGPDATSMSPDKDCKLDIINLVKNIRDVESDISPITWVAVGDQQGTRQFLTGIASIGGGEMVELADMKRLSRHYTLQSHVGGIYAYMKKQTWDGNTDMLESVTSALMGEVAVEEKESVVQAVKRKLEFEDVPDPDQDPDDFENVHEVDGIPPLGTRVVRGPDWQYTEQDLDGPGTVINHSSKTGCLWVYWDLSHTPFRYRYGTDNKTDVVPVDDQPRFLTANELIEIGVRVKRGPDWTYGDQDGGPGNTGVVIRIRGDAVVKVKWLSNNTIQAYKFGTDGRMELSICDPEDFMEKAPIVKELEVRPDTAKGGPTVAETSREKPHIIWQWRDEQNQWKMYDKKHQDKLEKDYRRRPTGSSLVQRGGKNIRVLFSPPMHERSTGSGVRLEVKRSAVSDEEFASLEEIQRLSR